MKRAQSENPEAGSAPMTKRQRALAESTLAPPCTVYEGMVIVEFLCALLSLPERYLHQDVASSDISTIIHELISSDFNSSIRESLSQCATDYIVYWTHRIETVKEKLNQFTAALACGGSDASQINAVNATIEEFNTSKLGSVLFELKRDEKHILTKIQLIDPSMFTIDQRHWTVMDYIRKMKKESLYEDFNEQLKYLAVLRIVYDLLIFPTHWLGGHTYTLSDADAITDILMALPRKRLDKMAQYIVNFRTVLGSSSVYMNSVPDGFPFDPECDLDVAKEDLERALIVLSEKFPFFENLPIISEADLRPSSDLLVERELESMFKHRMGATPSGNASQ